MLLHLLDIHFLFYTNLVVIETICSGAVVDDASFSVHVIISGGLLIKCNTVEP